MNINLNFILESSSDNSKNKILLSDYLLRFPRLVSKEGLLNLNENMFYNLRESYTSIRCFDEDCMIESVIINLERGYRSSSTGEVLIDFNFDWKLWDLISDQFLNIISVDPLEFFISDILDIKGLRKCDINPLYNRYVDMVGRGKLDGIPDNVLIDFSDGGNEFSLLYRDYALFKRPSVYINDSENFRNKVKFLIEGISGLPSINPPKP